MYAVVETGGKQYRVAKGDNLLVERLTAEKGDTVEFDRVLLIADGDTLTVGQPVISGARVVATVSGEERGKKIIVFKYKPKTRYRRKLGHRQNYTRVFVREIVPSTNAVPGSADGEA